ncbi:MAG: hypothetical protein KJP00_12925 [Bacteroidia bacterium]|nr:hypothetical protein [Bacteroidia bacterium]
MRQISLCFVTILFSTFLYGQRKPASFLGAKSSFASSETTITKRLENKFRRDAARLVLRMEAEQQDLRYGNIEITQSDIDRFYAILSKIYQTDKIARSVAKCNVHTFPNVSIDYFVVIYKKDVPWAAPLKDDIAETNSVQFNNLLEMYDLTIAEHQKWTDSQDAVTIRSRNPLNITALANEFSNIEGVVDIDMGVPEIMGNDIQIRRTPEGWRLDYILKISGGLGGEALKTHTWSWLAKENGDVKFIEEKGAPVPEWMRCELQKLSQI